jgi:hypothetical protein
MVFRVHDAALAAKLDGQCAVDCCLGWVYEFIEGFPRGNYVRWVPSLIYGIAMITSAPLKHSMEGDGVSSHRRDVWGRPLRKQSDRINVQKRVKRRRMKLNPLRTS